MAAGVQAVVWQKAVIVKSNQLIPLKYNYLLNERESV